MPSRALGGVVRVAAVIGALLGCQEVARDPAAGVAGVTLAPEHAGDAARPNLVLIYCDDMGWGDVPGFVLDGTAAPSYTSDLPNLARLAREGACFRHYYSAQPVCSASRAAILTGCYPNRIGIHGALFPDAKGGIDPGERTLAELLRERGYATMLAGKWHLGHRDEYLPTRHGFDEFLGIPYSNDMWPHRFRGTSPELPLYDGTDVVEHVTTLKAQGELTARLTHRAVDFIERKVHDHSPFFVMLAHPQPHAPIACGEDFTPAARRELYGAVMRELDWSVGEVLAALDRTGSADQTIVMFASDNGPWLAFGSDAGSTGGLREGKGTCFEGGVRVPCIMRWPGHIPSGCASDVPWMSIDLFATMRAITGAAAPEPGRPIDGCDARLLWSCSPLATPTHEAFWFYYHTNRLECIRMGKWKLSLPRKSRTLDGRSGGDDGSETAYVEREVPLELFDLEADPGERVNLAAEHPGVIARMMEEVARARADLGDASVGALGRGRRDPSPSSPAAP